MKFHRYTGPILFAIFILLWGSTMPTAEALTDPQLPHDSFKRVHD